MFITIQPEKQLFGLNIIMFEITKSTETNWFCFHRYAASEAQCSDYLQILKYDAF